MKHVLVIGAALVLLVAPSALGATPAPGAKTMRGTVVAKDTAHHGLVVAAPGGAVMTVAAPRAFAETDVGRRVVVRYRLAAGLRVALNVTRGSEARKALVRGTVIRVGRGQAVLSAGGSALSVSLATPKRQRLLSSSGSGPEPGDHVKIEVEIDDDGSLDAAGVTITTVGSAAAQSAAEGALEVRGIVTALTPGLVVKTGTGVVVTCVVPAGATLTGVAVGDLVEMKCDLVAGQWTLRKVHAEDEDDDDHSDDDQHGGDDGLEVKGTITSLDPLTVTGGSGASVVCHVPAGLSLAGFAVNQLVEMECRTIDGVLTLERLKVEGSDDDHEDDEDDGDDD